MAGGVRFDDDTIPIPPVRPHSVGDRLIGAGVAVNQGHAQLLLALVAALAVIGAIYFMLSAVPPLPELGEDRPRPGETIPSNRSI